MIRGVDLFAGGGGTTTGATQAGVNILWAANHNPTAVDFFKLNHPEVNPICQDLHQADWSLVPEHDILYASPCCQGHSRAAGKVKKTLKADLSRSTAWAVVSCLEVHKTPMAIIENVEDFLLWVLYPAWEAAMNALGYSLSVNLVNLAHLGGPQSRERLNIIATRSANPIELSFPEFEMVPASSFLDLSMDSREWDKVENRVIKTRNRVANGRKQHGDIFLDASYGSAKGGRSIHKPLGTVTCVNKHSLVIGDNIGPITLKEGARAQTFPDDYIWPSSKTLTKNMIGNAVPPLMAREVTKAALRAA